MNVKWLRLWLPILILLVMGIILAQGLKLDPRDLPSVKIGKPAPAFNLPVLGTEKSAFSSESMRGKVWVLNVFASWCTACLAEHQSLLKFSKERSVPLLGLSYKDAPADTQGWLKDHGSPYQLVALDQAGNVGINFGVYGVPETFVIDAEGIIRFRQAGPLGEDFYEAHVAPVMAEMAAKLPSKTSSSSENSAASDSPLPDTSAVHLSEAQIEERTKNLAKELRCLVCQNQTIADSTAALAVDLKRQIQAQIRAGKSDDQIKAYMLERYGEFILYKPPFNAKNALLWGLPLLLMIIGFIFVWRLFANAKLTEKRLENPSATLNLDEIEKRYQNTLENMQISDS